METRLTLGELLERIGNADPDVRTEAWLRAGEVGAPAVRPLAKVIAETGPLVAQLARELARLEIAGGDAATREQIARKQEQLTQPMESGRAAKRSLWKIVRHVSRPGADAERRAVIDELRALLADDQPDSLRKEVLWMFAEAGGEESVPELARLLANKALQEDARLALERIPGPRSLAALQEALSSAPPEFRVRIAQSLRARGLDVPADVWPLQAPAVRR